MSVDVFVLLISRLVCSRTLTRTQTLSNPSEFTLGVRLGEGAFCDVKEITAITLKRKEMKNGINGNKSGNQRQLAASIILPAPKEVASSAHSSAHDKDMNETDEADFPVNMFQNKDEIRKYMSEYCIRQDEIEGDQARYALKQLKPTDSKKQIEQGLIDISIEAKFLSCLNHPNIIKMRGVSGVPLTPNFGIVLDRLYMTLEDKMDMWTADKKLAASGGVCGCLFGKIDPYERARLLCQAVTVAYDLSCALRYIHSNK